MTLTITQDGCCQFAYQKRQTVAGRPVHNIKKLGQK